MKFVTAPERSIDFLRRRSIGKIASMQIAFISDIHANLVAFETVLRDIDRRKPDRIVFLGDACTLGPQPQEVLDLLRSLDCPCILGNHDGFVFDRRSAPDLEWTSRWFADQCRPIDLDFLRTFQPALVLDLDESTRVICYHGSPKSNTDQILPSTPEETLDAYLEGYPGRYYLGGHTHIQMMKQFKGKWIINPGSVGMPFERVPFPLEEGPRLLPWAEYAILAWDGTAMGVELRRLPIDMGKLKESYAMSAMPDGMYWWSLWLER